MIFLDGALGSILLQRANKPSTGLWSAQFLLNDPDAIKSLYEDYVSNKTVANAIMKIFKLNNRIFTKCVVEKSSGSG